MQPRLLTRDAFRTFYASNRLVVATKAVVRKLDLAAFGSLDFLVLMPGGYLATPEENDVKADGLISAVGAPLGLLGLVTDAAFRSVAADWADWHAVQTGREAPDVAELSRWPSAASVLTAISGFLLRDAEASRASAARTEEDLAVLRRDFERALINLEKARRVIRGAGYDTRYATLSVPVGSETESPPPQAREPLEPFVKTYPLPVDAAGLVGISLHFQVPEKALSEGRIEVAIHRAVDMSVLGRAKVPFSALSTGWFYFEFERVVQRSFGDAVLSLEWFVDTDGGLPAVSLSDLKLEISHVQDKAPADRLPAMQIWSGFSPGELAEDSRFQPDHLEQRRNSFGALMKYGELLEASARDADSVTQNPNWVQTHVVADGPVGLKFDSFVPGKARSVDVSVRTAHAAGPPCLYLVALARQDAKLDEDIMSRLLEDARKGNRFDGVDEQLGLCWSVKLLPPGRRDTIELEIPSQFQGDGSLSLATAVISATDKHAYGWCRWEQLTVTLAPDHAFGTLPSLSKVEPQPMWRIRSLKFPEISERLEFLAGSAKLHKLTKEFGFSPMIVGEDNGSLQTHPLLGEVSAALYRGGAPAGTLRIACDVETAHERSPEFRYILAVIPSKQRGKYKCFKDFLENRLPQERHGSKGYDQQSGIHYCSRRLAALEVSMLSIDLDVRLEEDHDIIAATMAVHESVSYGWCRWMSLSISSSMDDQESFSLSLQAG